MRIGGCHFLISSSVVSIPRKHSQPLLTHDKQSSFTNSSWDRTHPFTLDSCQNRQASFTNSSWEILHSTENTSNHSWLLSWLTKIERGYSKFWKNVIIWQKFSPCNIIVKYAFYNGDWMYLYEYWTFLISFRSGYWILTGGGLCTQNGFKPTKKVKSTIALAYEL